MHVLIMTVVHHPHDARILHRQARALLEAGHQVTYVAPWSATGTEPPPDVDAADVPRAQGRRRIRAWVAARRRLRELRASADLVLLHDPELVLAVAGLRRPPTVWDVHEDTAAALSDKPWLPAWSRRWLAWMVRGVERLAARRMHVIVANDRHRDRFPPGTPVVPNDPWVPETASEAGDDRVVYLGRISVGRGARELLDLAERLPEGVALELIGPVDDEIADDIKAAAAAGRVTWHGFVPNAEALTIVDGAMAGLSLLRNEPNYQANRPTKITEYMARGLPVITTPNPVAAEIVTTHECGLVVDFDRAAEETTECVAKLRSDPGMRARMAQRGRTAALEHYSWNRSGREFVALMETVAERGDQVR